MKPVRICLWSGPRNISTSLMYSFAQRSNCKVVDEPLYAHYLSQLSEDERARHPAANEIMASMEQDGAKVVEMMTGDFGEPTEVLFFKNMTHHLPGIDRSFMKDVVNVILTRDPENMLPSYDKVIKNPSLSDTGYDAHIELLDYFNREGITPIVVDSKSIQEDAERVLRELCKRAEVVFDSAMLKWEAGPKKEDGIWAKYWYSSTHDSTGFLKFTPKKDTFPQHLTPLLLQCKPLYKRLEKLAI